MTWKETAEVNTVVMCCGNCFDDEKIKQRIEQEGIRAHCDYCKTRDTACINASKLQSEFAKFCDIYVASRCGLHFPEGVGLVRIIHA